ncbi:hypothetical protein Dsin_020499 [Dipteronia sinensis]|uniref:Uncharacterized protein n=1 Tax=Dipteronia sinensis TaxID=43782 RepID=A0AAE0AAH3_9ROSI|nr:hypothetical protein Dsin_020499 [Dipteronia sinensis]
MMGAGQQVDPFLSTQYEMNALTIHPSLYAMNWKTIDPSMNTLIEIIPEGFSSTSDQLETTLAPLPGHLTYLNGEELASSVLPASVKHDIALNEETEVIPEELANYVINPNWMPTNHQKELRDEPQSPQGGEESVNKPETEDGKCTLQEDADDDANSYALC